MIGARRAGHSSERMDDPVAIDGSDGPLSTRRVVVWRRLEPGDVRTPGTELTPESPHIEAKIVTVGVAASLRDELERLWAKKLEATAAARGWSTRYEPAGVPFALGGGLAIGAWLDFLPDVVLPFAGSLTTLGAAIGFFTRTRKRAREREAEQRWQKMPEREQLAAIEKTLRPRWERFAERLKDEQGFRTDVRVGDIHEADRLVSLDVDALVNPATWTAEPGENEVRYGWVYADGRVVEQVAELEDTEREPEAHSGYASLRAEDGARDASSVEAPPSEAELTREPEARPVDARAVEAAPDEAPVDAAEPIEGASKRRRLE